MNETIPEDSGPQTEEQPVGFLDSLPEDLRAEPSLQNFTDAGGLARARQHFLDAAPVLVAPDRPRRASGDRGAQPHGGPLGPQRVARAQRRDGRRGLRQRAGERRVRRRPVEVRRDAS